MQDIGIPIIFVGQSRSRINRLLRIAKELKKQPADIVQSQHFYANAYAALAALFSRCPGVGALRSNGCFDLLQSGRMGLINLHLPRILAANSRSAIQYATEHSIPAGRLHFLPNVVDTDRFTPPDAGGRPQNTLLAVGRLSREKRFDRFLFLIKRLRCGHQLNVRGLIVGPTRGDERLRRALETQAAALGLLPDGVQFLGSITEMQSVYRQATICVLTSEHEGTPNVLLEAMASGLPVVATKVGGVPEIVVEGETGFLFSEDDSEGQVEALAKLICNPELRAQMGTRARAFVEANHSRNQLPIELSRLYQLAFSKNKRSRLRCEQNTTNQQGLGWTIST